MLEQAPRRVPRVIPPPGTWDRSRAAATGCRGLARRESPVVGAAV